jgi:hypothetical protein
MVQALFGAKKRGRTLWRWYHTIPLIYFQLPNNAWTIRTLKGRKMCLLSKKHMPFYANAKEIYKTLV